jgi:hydroxypyruvate isomerase
MTTISPGISRRTALGRIAAAAAAVGAMPLLATADTVAGKPAAEKVAPGRLKQSASLASICYMRMSGRR